MAYRFEDYVIVQSDIVEIPNCDTVALIRSDTSPCHSVLIVKILQLCDIQQI